MNVVTLTTDIGWRYAAQMKGCIMSIAPEAVIVDVAHDVAPQDILEGAFVLYAVAPQFNNAVHISVVDPGVGISPKAIIAACDHGCLVGPDNGVLIPAARRLGLRQVYEITAEEYMAEAIAPTFHGREVFAPVAAHLSCGVDPFEMGQAINDPVPLRIPEPQLRGDIFSGQVIRVDHFGNLITNIPRSTLERSFRLPGPTLDILVKRRKVQGLAKTYAEREEGQLLALIGSSGYLEVAVNRGSAAQLLGCEKGDSATLTVSEDEG